MTDDASCHIRYRYGYRRNAALASQAHQLPRRMICSQRARSFWDPSSSHVPVPSARPVPDVNTPVYRVLARTCTSTCLGLSPMCLSLSSSSPCWGPLESGVSPSRQWALSLFLQRSHSSTHWHSLSLGTNSPPIRTSHPPHALFFLQQIPATIQYSGTVIVFYTASPAYSIPRPAVGRSALTLETALAPPNLSPLATN